MGVINTRLFSLKELDEKSYGNLLIFLEGLIEISCELHEELTEIESFEDENGILESPMLSDSYEIATQLDYIDKNIGTTISVLKNKEAKSFIEFIGFPSICLN